MEQVKLVIFDMDGLLFDTEKTFFQAFQRAAKRLGHDFDFQTYLQVVGVTDEIGKQIFSEIYGAESTILNAFDTYHDEFDQILNEEGLALKPGAKKLLDVLDERGIKRCIASSSSMKMIERNLHVAGIGDRFDFYVSGDEVKNGKPNPDIFLEALRRAGEEAEHAIVLEDSYHGLQAAVAADIRCIIVPDLIEPTDEMHRQAFRIYTNLGEVARLINEK